MGNSIDLFMWGYQQYYRVSVQVTAESIFNKIDKRLAPKVFLLGILVDKRENRYPVCLEPDDCGYQVEAFNQIKSLASELEEANQESKLLHSHPIAQEAHNRRISHESYIEAIQKIIKKEKLYGKTESYVSYPAYVEGYLVYIILELDKSIVSSYYSLSKNKTRDRYTISRSFIESIIQAFLKECSTALKDPNKGINAIERDADEIIRVAGKSFMYTISQAGENFYGLHGLYDACNMISSLKYEGAEGIGNMIIAKHDHDNIKFSLELKNPISINDFRKVRKFLELSNESSYIICDSSLIYGLGHIFGKYNSKSESLFKINFLSHYKWEVEHDNNVLMAVEYRQPQLPKDKINKNLFYSDLSRIFKGITKNQLNDLWEIVIEATKQQHGTMLVITDNAEEESLRLNNQSFAILPTKFSVNFIQSVTSIDGAVLLDRNSLCHSIGVILDGLSTEKGDSSRGARYNSAIRYYEQFKDKTSLAIVIISEDGMINIIPNLKPQIKHKTILDAIEELQGLSQSPNLERKRYNKLMGYFQENSFYLTDAECQNINNLRDTIESKPNEDDVRIVWEDIMPDAEMNDSYYSDNN